MGKFSPANERIKHRYLAFLGEAKRFSTSSVDQAAAAIADFEASTGFKDFRQFRIEQAQSYKRKLGGTGDDSKKRGLAKATISSRLAALKAFFQWLAQQPGFKSRLTYSDAEYFNASANDERIARAIRERPVPTVEQIRHVLRTMPSQSDIERRNQALIAFTLLSGARDNAIASMSLKHIDLVRRRVYQDAREVRTKNAKTITSTFFPVGTDIELIVENWVRLLGERLWGPDDPLFPATKVALGDSGHFETAGLDRNHWKDAAAIRRIFKESFEAAGLPYFNPHSFRNTLASLGEKICESPEAFKAWSQNLGHTHVLTTFTSYGAVAFSRQAEILSNLQNVAAPADAEPDAATIHRVIAHLQNKSRL
jgi:integrase/recombinase XerC